MSFLGLFGGDSSSAPATVESYQRPAYQPSPYSAGASENINNFYTSRVNGENLGYRPEDLDTMNASAIDTSNYMTNEAVRRGASARRTPGGVTTGGQGALRENAVMSGLQNRSAALRDIAVQNSVLKHNDQWNAAQGLQAFLNEQDANALGIYNAQQSGFNSDNQTAVLQNLYTQKQQSANNNATMGSLGSLASQALSMFGSSGGGGGGGGLTGQQGADAYSGASGVRSDGSSITI